MLRKNIVICFDGTWNTVETRTNVVRTADMIEPYNKEGEPQIVYYDPGVGSSKGAVCKNIDKFLGGAFGVGLMDNVTAAYRFLAYNYRPGDKIFIFGFSRGAFSARSLSGLIRNCGIVRSVCAARLHKDGEQIRDMDDDGKPILDKNGKPIKLKGAITEALRLYKNREDETAPDAEESCRFRKDNCTAEWVSDEDRAWRIKNGVPGAENEPRLRIEFMGIWDTVGALGVPGHILFADFFNRHYQFHDHKLSSLTRSARHALGIDETRRIYDATVWELGRIERLNKFVRQDRGHFGSQLARHERPYQQQWFPGDHGSIGGGGKYEGITHGTLDWVLEGAEQRGLLFNEEERQRRRRPGKIDWTHPVDCMGEDRAWSPATRGNRSVPERKDLPGREEELSELLKGYDTLDKVHFLSKSVIERYNTPAEKLHEKQIYRPAPLAPFRKLLEPDYVEPTPWWRRIFNWSRPAG